MWVNPKRKDKRFGKLEEATTSITGKNQARGTDGGNP